MTQYFSAGLYREGLKRVRTMGVTAALVMISGSVWRIFMKSFEKQTVYNEIGVQEITQVSAAKFMPMCILALFFAPLIVKSAFSFLNKRSHSDFYHSVPQKRACVYISFTASVLTWIVGISAACALCCYFGWNALIGYSASAAVAAKAALSYTALGLLGASCMALGMMYTGSSTAGVLAGLTILGLPVAAIAAFGSVLCSFEPSLVYEKTLIYRLTQRYFLPFAFNPSSSADGDFFNPKGLAVWLAVAVSAVLFILAGVAYVRRKSETAENAASSPLVRRVLLLCFTLIPCLLATICAVQGSISVTLTLSLWLWSLIMYCIFEIIMTKSFKSLARSLPLFLILPLVCALLAGSAYLGAAKVHAGNPKSAGEVEYVVIDRSYAEFPMDRIIGEKISDAAVIEAVTDGFRYSDEFRRGADDFGRSFFMLKLNNGKKLWRKCVSDTTVLGRALLNCPQTRGKLLALPDVVETNCSGEVWESFKSEYNALTDEQKCETLVAKQADREIRVWTNSGVYKYMLSESLFPRTCGMIKAADGQYY